MRGRWTLAVLLGGVPGCVAFDGPVPPERLYTESTWCWTTRFGDFEGLHLSVVGMDSGTQVGIGPLGSSLREGGAFSLSYVDGAFVTIAQEGFEPGYVAIDPVDEVVTTGALVRNRPRTLASFEGQLLREGRPLTDANGQLTGREIEVFDDFASLEGSPTEVWQWPALPEQTLGSWQVLDRQRVASIWIVSRELFILSRIDGAVLETVPLDDDLDIAFGMSIAGGLLHVLKDPGVFGASYRIERRSLDDGTLVDFVSLTPSQFERTAAFGLWCDAKR